MAKKSRRKQRRQDRPARAVAVSDSGNDPGASGSRVEERRSRKEQGRREREQRIRRARLRRLLRRAVKWAKVIMAPYPDLEQGRSLALVGWTKLQQCPRVTDADDAITIAQAFLSEGASVAPEPGAP